MAKEPTGAAVWLGLAGWIALAFLAALPGVLVTTAAAYQGLAQPTWAPPSWVFGPVWTVLYALMGAAAWLVWKAPLGAVQDAGGFAGVRVALGLFLVQLGLNALWTPLFFGAGLRGWAFVDICALWAALVATVVAFFRRRPAAGALLVPYLLWVTFAAALNFAIWRMNA
jgi:tryptophan-rich sensory protein